MVTEPQAPRQNISLDLGKVVWSCH